jgi:hypothetical protein
MAACPLYRVTLIMQFTYSPTSPVPILLTVGEIEDGQEFDFNEIKSFKNAYYRDGVDLKLMSNRLTIIKEYWKSVYYRDSMIRPAIIHP